MGPTLSIVGCEVLSFIGLRLYITRALKRRQADTEGLAAPWKHSHDVRLWGLFAEVQTWQ